MIRRLARWFDERLDASHFARSTLDKVFPDHWAFMLGELALYSFVILVLTGIYLTFFFVPSAQQVAYHGSYKPLRGVHMSAAYRSTLRISFDVRAGLVMRQVHHWAALVFLASVVAHLCRVFFTGAFRCPRELNWIVGVTLLILGLANGFTGYSLPDDLLSGTGLRVTYSFMLSIPFVGTWLAYLFFGGEYGAPDVISRFFVIHILLVPLAILALLSAHLAILWRQKHSQFRGRGRREGNVVGSRLWPTYAMKSVGLFAAVISVLCFLGGLAQINPIWLYGPYRPAAVSTAAQPDWYLGWAEGAVRLFPPWDLHIAHHTIGEVFWPSILVPGFTFLLLYAWPFLEARMTHDHAEHHLLDRPSDRPVRTAIGVGVLTFYVVLTVAGGQDIIAQKLRAPIDNVLNTLRVLVLALPPVTALIAWKLCTDLRAGGHARAEEAATEPPIGPAELPIGPAELTAAGPAHLVDRSGAGAAGPAGATGARAPGTTERTSPPAPRRSLLREVVDRVLGTALVLAVARAARRARGGSEGSAP